MRATSLFLAALGLSAVIAADVPVTVDEGCFRNGSWPQRMWNYNNVEPASSAVACANICRLTSLPSGCQKWTWSGPGTVTVLPNQCYKFSDTNFSDVGFQFDQTKMVSGLRYCPVPYGECFSANVGYGMPTPEDATHYTLQATAELCQTKCQQTPGCFNFTWIDPDCVKPGPTGEMVRCTGGGLPLTTCIVYFGNNMGDGVPRLESSEGCISGPPKCPCDGTIKYFFCSHLDELVDHDMCYSVNPDNGDCDVDVAFYCPGKSPQEVVDLCDCGKDGCLGPA